MAVAGLVLFGLARTMRLSPANLQLQDTTAQIRVRGAFLLVAVFLLLAGALGPEVTLGRFIAGQLSVLLPAHRAHPAPVRPGQRGTRGWDRSRSDARD